MPSGKTQIVDERDKYRNAEVMRAKAARTFEEAGMVEPASRQWGYAADNADVIVQMAATYPMIPLDPMMPIISGAVRQALSRAHGRSVYYRARAAALLEGPPPVGPASVQHPYFPLPNPPAPPAPGSPEANATPSTPDAAAQADADEADSKWLLVAVGAGLLLAYKVFFGG